MNLKDMENYVEVHTESYVEMIRKVKENGVSQGVPITSEMAWDMVNHAIEGFKNVKAIDHMEDTVQKLLEMVGIDLDDTKSDSVSDWYGDSDDIPF